MKKFYASLLLLLSINVTSFAQQGTSDNQNLPWIKFHWKGTTMGNTHYDKAFMYIPVKIGSLPYQFEAQFDLGSFATILYGKPLATLTTVLPDLQDKGDTLSIKNKKFPLIKHVNLKLDQVSFSDLTVVKLPDFGKAIPADSLTTATVKSIGTIGADLFQDKILIIDYPNQRLCAIDELPAALRKRLYPLNARYSGDRVSIPFKIGAQEEFLMFDTGSSAFPVLTLPQNAALISDSKAQPSDSLKVSSWGSYFYMYKKPMNKKMSLGKFPIQNNTVFYSEKAVSSVKFFEEHQIFGFTGNILFLDKVIMVDYKNKKFGILQ